jgi:hypothetical protein
MELLVDETPLSTEDQPAFDKLLVASILRVPQSSQCRIRRAASIRRRVVQSSYEDGVLRDLQFFLHASPRRTSTTPL